MELIENKLPFDYKSLLSYVKTFFPEATLSFFNFRQYDGKPVSIFFWKYHIDFSGKIFRDEAETIDLIDSQELMACEDEYFECEDLTLKEFCDFLPKAKKEYDNYLFAKTPKPLKLIDCEKEIEREE